MNISYPTSLSAEMQIHFPLICLISLEIGMNLSYASLHDEAKKPSINWFLCKNRQAQVLFQFWTTMAAEKKLTQNFCLWINIKLQISCMDWLIESEPVLFNWADEMCDSVIGKLSIDKSLKMGSNIRLKCATNLDPKDDQYWPDRRWNLHLKVV